MYCTCSAKQNITWECCYKDYCSMIANPLSYVNSKHSYSFDVVSALFRNKIMATHYDAIMTLLCSSILLPNVVC